MSLPRSSGASIVVPRRKVALEEVEKHLEFLGGHRVSTRARGILGSVVGWTRGWMLECTLGSTLERTIEFSLDR
jgi:hypothetical protein